MLGFLLSVLVILLAWCYYDSKRKHQYWKNKGVPYVTPIPLFGSSLKIILMMQSQYGMVRRSYNKFKNEKYVGIYEGNTPAFIPIDNELIGKICVKDFSHFVDHGFSRDDPETEIDETLFFMNGSKWRTFRYKMLPAFTTGKLKWMFPEIVKCADSWIKRLKTLENQDVELLELNKEFSIAVIANCAFGIELPMEPNSEFMQMVTAYLKTNIKRHIEVMLLYFIPPIGRMLGITFTPRKVAKYFSGLIRETFLYRTKNEIVRNDFVQLLLELKQKGSLEMNSSKDSEDKYLHMDPPPPEKLEITDQMLISQAFNFIQGGFDGFIYNTMLILYEFSVNPKIQEKARLELQNVVSKYGDITYDVFKETTYFNNCIKEGLRKYPPAPVNYRQCTKKYWIDDGICLEPGTNVYIPVLGLHRDPQYFPEPELFNPDRFLEEPVPYTYLPFGDGPRMCIAMRFALLVMKLACSAILLNFNLELSSKTKLPLKMDHNSFFPQPKTPVYFRLTKLK